MEKEKRRFVIEMGTGIDLHGCDVTKAATRAVKDAISRSCLCGLVEIVELRDLNDMRIDVLVAVPMPEQVQADAVLNAAPSAPRGGVAAPVGSAYRAKGGENRGSRCVFRW